MKKQSNYKDDGADEIKRMMILKEMEELELEAELDVAEKIIAKRITSCDNNIPPSLSFNSLLLT